jgi:hypothetical protein
VRSFLDDGDGDGDGDGDIVYCLYLDGVATGYVQ